MALLKAKDMIEDHLDLVSLPEIALRINQLIDDPNSTAEHIAELISQDAPLTIRLLKIVNSPFYNFASQIDTVSSAISIIGTRELRDLVMATAVIEKFNNIPTGLITPESFWRHNIACATAARTIAKQLKVKNSERLYIAGLLHDIGKLVMYLASPELSRQVMDLIKLPNADINQIEKIAFGFNHGELGAELIKQWNLPDMLVKTTQHHHQPSNANNFSTEVSVIHLANVIANLIEEPFSLDDDIPVENNVLLLLKCEEPELDEITEESKLNYTETVELIYHKTSA